MLHLAYDCVTNFLSVLLLILLMLGMLKIIAEWSSRIEEDFWDIFDPKELQHNYYPILMDKKEKGAVVSYKFYSLIPYNTWIRNRERISDVFGGFVEIEHTKKHEIILRITERKRICEYTFIGIDAFGYPQSKVIEETF